MSDDVQPGLLVLHGNRTELLGEAVFDWLAVIIGGPRVARDRVLNLNPLQI